MKTLFSDKVLTYDGSQLKSLYSFLNYKVHGDSVLSWMGPCDIPHDKIVDGQDLLEGSIIYSENMLHFIVEIFDAKLIQMVLMQRLFCEIIKEEVLKISQGLDQQVQLLRLGDDLYLKSEVKSKDKKASKSELNSNKNKESDLDYNPIKNIDYKFNISIATISPVSGLIHFGINISSKNTPVKTYSLNDLDPKINISEFSNKVMQKLSAEWTSSVAATQKVKWVK